MKINVRLFAGARQLLGSERLEVEVPEGATVAELRRILQQVAPALTPLLVRTRIAVNLDFAPEQTQVPVNAEVALIPPVSGG